MLQDRKNPFYRPLWVRIAILAVCAGWSFFEVSHGDPLWTVLALGVTAYALWSFFIAYAPEDKPAPPAGE